MTATPCVLVVDAPAAAAETADRLESRAGVECVTASDVPAALAALDARVVDCVVSEYEVPDGHGRVFRGGLRLLEHVRERDPDVPFVLFTDVRTAAVAWEALAGGVTAYLRKVDRPAADDLLAERVANAVDRRAAVRRDARQRAITGVVRDANAALVRADSREEIERVLPAELADDPYEVAAFVRTHGTDASVVAVDGADPPLAVGDDADAAVTDVAGVHVLEEAASAPAGLATGDRRVAVVPVVFEDRRFGVLLLATASPGAFDEAERAVLAELGETAAYAIEAVETRAQLERQNERLETFTNVVSHDLRNPLQVADVFLDAARREHDSDELRRVAEAHDRMAELIEDVLTLAREGRTVVDPEPVDLETVARDAWSTIDASGATLVVDATGAVRGDPSRVRQILENLFANAVEHGSTGPDAGESRPADERAGPEDAPDAGGSGSDRAPAADGAGQGHTDTARSGVTVRVGAFDGGFYVADDGPGIPAEEREDVFEMGYTTADAGTGYGLAIVAELADAHGWNVAVTESDAGGARFEVHTG